MLYVCNSSGDKLLPSSYISEYAAVCREKNVPIVLEHCFGDDVGHTAGFYVKQETYKSLVRNFFGFDDKQL
jgi:hypothetical protein